MENDTPKENLETARESRTTKLKHSVTEKCCQQFISRPWLKHLRVKRHYNYYYS